MFDVGFWELVLVGLVALLAFGPNELPRLVRDTVRVVRKLRAAANAAGDELRRELHLDDLDDEHLPHSGSPLHQVRDVMNEIASDINRPLPPPLPRSKPGQDDAQT